MQGLCQCRRGGYSWCDFGAHPGAPFAHSLGMPSPCCGQRVAHLGREERRGSMYRVTRILTAALALGLTTTAQAQEEEQGRTQLDNDFLVKAHSCNNAAIEFSKLADKRAASDKVKEFAKQMRKEHEAIQEGLSRLFKDRKIASVAGLEKEFRDERDRLSKLEGADFDRAYLKRVAEDHEKAVSHFEVQSRDGKDNAITAWAKENLPGLKKHQQTARDMLAALDKK